MIWLMILRVSALQKKFLDDYCDLPHFSGRIRSSALPMLARFKACVCETIRGLRAAWTMLQMRTLHYHQNFVIETKGSIYSSSVYGITILQLLIKCRKMFRCWHNRQLGLQYSKRTVLLVAGRFLEITFGFTKKLHYYRPSCWWWNVNTLFQTNSLSDALPQTD